MATLMNESMSYSMGLNKYEMSWPPYALAFKPDEKKKEQ
jgi:hypothetical protein